MDSSSDTSVIDFIRGAPLIVIGAAYDGIKTFKFLRVNKLSQTHGPIVAISLMPVQPLPSAAMRHEYPDPGSVLAP
jgi:hypothetical protein